MSHSHSSIITALKNQLHNERKKNRKLEAVLLCRNKGISMLIDIQREISHATAELLMHKSISRDLRDDSAMLAGLHDSLQFQLNIKINMLSHKEDSTNGNLNSIYQDEIESKIKNIKKLSILNFKFNSAYSYISILNTVKIDHVLWKASLYDMLVNESFNINLECSTECRLGKWYAKMKSDNFLSGLQEFIAISYPHELMHKSGDLAINQCKKGNYHDMIINLNKMEGYSSDVINCIDRLIYKVRNTIID